MFAREDLVQLWEKLSETLCAPWWTIQRYNLSYLWKWV